MSSTRSVVLYLLATQRKTLAGLTIPGEESANKKKKPANPFENSVLPVGGEIGLDDRAYPGMGRACFSLQDESGLLGLNNFLSAQIEKLLGLSGVPAGRRGPLVDKLLDYTDADDLNRLNGAEAGDYERLGLQGPPNRHLLTTWEIGNVLGWKDVPELWKENALPRLTTVAGGGMPNLNTAPRQILKTVAGVDDETAKRLIDAREAKPFSRVKDVSQAAGKALSLDPMGTAFFPSVHLRVTLWHTAGRRMREIHLSLTPRADKKAPWVIDYELSAELTQNKHNDLQTLSIPAFK